MDIKELDDTFDYSQLGQTADAYEFGQHLGDGGFGRVYAAVDKATGREVAIKVLDKKRVYQRNMSSRVVSEINIHQHLKHPFVLQLYSYFEDNTNVYLVLELCHRGNLHDYVKHNGRLSEDKVRYFMKQIIAGLKYLHQSRIMHRDLTLANLLLTKDNRVKISDFGLASEVSEDRTNKTMCGTPNYISPEVSSQGVQGLEVDVWSLGIMLYTMLVGKAPFDTKDPKSTIDNARRLRYDIPGSLNAEAIDLITKLLREMPLERLPLTDILLHPFMRKTAHERSGSNDSGNDSIRSGGAPGQRCHSVGEHSRHSDSQGYVSAAHSDSSPLQHRRPILAANSPPSLCPSPQPRRHPPSPSPQAPSAAAAAATSSPQLSEASAMTSATQATPAAIDTRRLEACRVAKGNCVLTVEESGQLTVEQVRRRRGQQRVAKLLRVAPGGHRVQFAPSLNFGDGLPLGERPVDFDESDAEVFQHPQLSEQCSRMYQFAASFVAILRSNTPKLTLYTEAAKCVLYENQPEPDFSVHFYSGRRARRSARCQLSIDGAPAQLCGLTGDQAAILHYVNETYDQIRRIESVLSGVSSPGGADTFPAIVGRPPVASPAAAAASAPPLAVIDVRQPTAYDTVVTFNDASSLSLQQLAGSLQLLLYTDRLGHRQSMQAGGQLPAAVQLRLRLLLGSPLAPQLVLPKQDDSAAAAAANPAAAAV